MTRNQFGPLELEEIGRRFCETILIYFESYGGVDVGGATQWMDQNMRLREELARREGELVKSGLDDDSGSDADPTDDVLDPALVAKILPKKLQQEKVIFKKLNESRVNPKKDTSAKSPNLSKSLPAAPAIK